MLYFLLCCKALPEATLWSKNQIVIPREAREALGAKAGDKQLVVVRGERVIVLARFTKPRYAGLTDPIFAWLEQPNHEGIASTIAMTELLVPAYWGLGSAGRRVLRLLVAYLNLDWIAPNPKAADIAARIGARYRLRTPDALQAATAVQAQATSLVTNDPIFEGLDAFETLVLDGLL